MESPNLLAALAHAAAGRPVFPCRPDNKRPACMRGFHAAVTTERQVRAWWRPGGRTWAGRDDERAEFKNETLIIGMPTGRAVWGGCWVLDVDVHDGATGPATLALLEQTFGPLPPTVEARTATGGRHLYFRHPGAPLAVPNKSCQLGTGRETWGSEGYPEVPFALSKGGRLVVPGLDIRGDGGYVIVPGSEMLSSARYTWAPGCSPDEGMVIADAPDWLLALVSVDPEADAAPLAPPASAPPAPPPPSGARSPGGKSDFFRRVNAAALANFAAWVPILLPKATPYHGDGWRITSKALGRPFQEDLTFCRGAHGPGIRDFGPSPDQAGIGLTPIDVVLQYGSCAKPVDAAHWLCAQLGVAPEALGWTAPRARSAPPPPEAPPPAIDQPLDGWATCLDEYGQLMPDDEPPPQAPPPASDEPAPTRTRKQKRAPEAGGGATEPPGGAGGPVGGDGSGRPAWADALMYSDKGAIQAKAYNVRLILEHVAEWSGVLAWCDFSQRIICRAPPPFAGAPRGEWTDAHDTELRHWLAGRFRFEAKKTDIADAVLGVALAHRYHPVLDYLDTLVWDGRSRLHSWLQTYLGAADNANDPGLDDRMRADRDKYFAWVGPWWLIQSIARVRRPGCKADNVLILEGEQGVMKSTALKVLYSPDWFSDTRIDIGSKDAMLAMQGTWCVELAELDAMNKADMRTAKAYFSSAEDRFRLPYGHRLGRFPRQSVMAGTTNQREYLQDLTGNRRYWPIACGRIDIEGLAADRDQLWAEAQMRYGRQARWWAETPEEKSIIAEQQGERVAGDVWEARIQLYLTARLRACTPAQRVSLFVPMDAIMESALGMLAKDMRRPEQTRCGAIVQALGWHNTRPTLDGERVRGYRPGPRVLDGTAGHPGPQESDDDF